MILIAIVKDHPVAAFPDDPRSRRAVVFLVWRLCKGRAVMSSAAFVGSLPGHTEAQNAARQGHLKKRWSMSFGDDGQKGHVDL